MALTDARRIDTRGATMIALLSPAKTLDYQKPVPSVGETTPRFVDDATALAVSAAKLSAKRLSAIMDISDNLATLNRDRFRGFEALPERQAIYAFAGDVYVGFDVRSLDDAAVAFAQDHVRILSGLYGLLRPLDRIRPYRLEMGTKWAPRRGDLYGYWGSRIGDLLAEDLEAEGSGVVINLASREYFGAIETAPPAGARIIAIDFREEGPAGLRFNSFAAKRARGSMARYISEHRLDDPDALKGFDTDGYRYESDGSTDTLWRFVRR